MSEIQKNDGPIPRTAIRKIKAVNTVSVSYTKFLPPGGMT